MRWRFDRVSHRASDREDEDIVSANKIRINKHVARCIYESQDDVIKYPSARKLE